MKRVLAFGMVAAQVVLLAALLFVPRGSLWPENLLVFIVAILIGLAGAMIAALGVVSLGPALTASPIPREHAPLATRGVYGFIRNPIYTGLMAGGLGLTLLGASVWHILIWIGLVLLLAIKARWEERMLIAEHSDYADYGARVGRFIPGVGRLRPRD